LSGYPGCWASGAACALMAGRCWQPISPARRDLSISGPVEVVDRLQRAQRRQVNYIDGSGAASPRSRRARSTSAPPTSRCPDELAQVGLAQFPIVIGEWCRSSISKASHRAGEAHWPVLADIFLGKIQKWSDPAITGLNPV